MIVELYRLCDKTKRKELEKVCGIYAILYNNAGVYTRYKKAQRVTENLQLK